MKQKVPPTEYGQAHVDKWNRSQIARTEARREDSRGSELTPPMPPDPLATLAPMADEPEADLPHSPEHLPGRKRVSEGVSGLGTSISEKEVDDHTGYWAGRKIGDIVPISHCSGYTATSRVQVCLLPSPIPLPSRGLREQRARLQYWRLPMSLVRLRRNEGER